jgi:hypothetical protein
MFLLRVEVGTATALPPTHRFDVVLISLGPRRPINEDGRESSGLAGMSLQCPVMSFLPCKCWKKRLADFIYLVDAIRYINKKKKDGWHVL